MTEERRIKDRRVSPAIGDFALEERGELLARIAELEASTAKYEKSRVFWTDMAIRLCRDQPYAGTPPEWIDNLSTKTHPRIVEAQAAAVSEVAALTERQAREICQLNARIAELEQQRGGVVLPDGWVPLTIEHEPGYPEDVAFGPQRMMDRLKKWLDRYFAMRLNPPGECVAAPRDMRSVLSMILNALDRDAAEGKAARGEMAAELRSMIAQQGKAVGDE